MNEDAVDQPELLPAASCACAHQKYAPRDRPVAVHDPVAPFARPLPLDPEATTVVHALSEVTRNAIVAVSPTSPLLENVALSAGAEVTDAPFAGLVRRGTPGGLVSKTKLWDGVHAVGFAARSVARMRQ